MTRLVVKLALLTVVGLGSLVWLIVIIGQLGGPAGMFADTHELTAELAARIGTHREAITREMGWLAKNAVVEQVSPRRLTIHDPAALKRLAELATGDSPATPGPLGANGR